MGDAEPSADDRVERPFVSVVVPVYNDPEGVKETLESLSDQTYPDDRHEVLVVDNGSTDGTRSVAHEYAASFDPIKLVVEPRIQGSYAARNRGVANARGSVIAFIDADMTVGSDWLSGVADAMAGDVEYLACGVDLYSEGAETIPQKFDRLSGFDLERYLEELKFAPTCCLVVDAALFDDVGLFDSRLVSSGDLEFGQRVHASGRTLHYRPEITVQHPTRNSVRSLLGKAARIGMGRQQLRRYYPARYGNRLAGLLNPGAYVPPPPWQLPDRFREWDSLTVREKLSFYAITTATGLARTYGKVRETVSGGPVSRSGSPRATADESTE